jgi:hypothetical protein
MSIKPMSRYEPGSDEDRAYRLLIECEVEVDSVFGVERVRENMEAITFVAGGRALTAFADDEAVLRVAEGWDIPPPEGDLS